jgi:hypothetical protein
VLGLEKPLLSEARRIDVYAQRGKRPNRDESLRTGSVNGVVEHSARRTVPGGGSAAAADDTSSAPAAAPNGGLKGPGADSPVTRSAFQPSTAGGTAAKQLPWAWVDGHVKVWRSRACESRRTHYGAGATPQFAYGPLDECPPKASALGVPSSALHEETLAVVLPRTD